MQMSNPTALPENPPRPPAKPTQRSAVVDHLRASAAGLGAAARRPDAIPQVREKLRAVAAELRTTVAARRVRTLLGSFQGDQPEADQRRVHGSGSNVEPKGAPVDRPPAVRLDDVAGRLDVVAGRLDAVAVRLEPAFESKGAPVDRSPAVRLDDVAGRLDAVAGRLDAVADRLEPAFIESLAAAATPLFAAENLLLTAATRIENESFVLPADAAVVIKAASDKVKATVSRLPSAREFRDAAVKLSDAAVKLSNAAGALPGCKELSDAADEFRRVVGEYPIPPAPSGEQPTIPPAPSGEQPTIPPAPSGEQPTAAGKWDAAVLQLRFLAYELQDVVNEVKNVRLTLTEADADIVELRLVEQIRNLRGDILVQLCGGYPPTAFTQISNLLDIERDPRLKKAQEVWLQKEKDLSRKVVRREAASADVRTQIYNIIGWYAVYLGVVLSAVTQLTQTSSSSSQTSSSSSQTSSLVCGKWWFPFILTVVGTVITIIGLIYKFNSLDSLDDTIHSDRKISAEFQQRILRLEQNGLDFDFTEDVDNKSTKDIAKKPWKEYGLVIVALIVLAALFSYSYSVILCGKWKIQHREWEI